VEIPSVFNDGLERDGAAVRALVSEDGTWRTASGAEALEILVTANLWPWAVEEDGIRWQCVCAGIVPGGWARGECKPNCQGWRRTPLCVEDAATVALLGRERLLRAAALVAEVERPALGVMFRVARRARLAYLRKGLRWWPSGAPAAVVTALEATGFYADAAYRWADGTSSWRLTVVPPERRGAGR
jgi:hypothetical protein